MKFPDKYKSITKQVFTKNEYKIIPIRFEDRYKIMKWRNEQMFHLRQKTTLIKKNQDDYFLNTVESLFYKNHPSQILFSFLKKEECIGYGGLVHINWEDKHAEISFIMKTELEKEHFEEYWNIYLPLIENLAFNELNLHKLHTFAFDLRSLLYLVLETNKYKKEAILRDHCLINNKYVDVIIHSKINTNDKI